MFQDEEVGAQRRCSSVRMEEPCCAMCKWVHHSNLSSTLLHVLLQQGAALRDVQVGLQRRCAVSA